MENFDQSHHLHGESESDGAEHRNRPYWKHAHKDWRVWVGVVFVFVAIFIYVMSGDFGSLYHSRPQSAPSGAMGK
jgi:hypothetical protein